MPPLLMLTAPACYAYATFDFRLSCHAIFFDIYDDAADADAASAAAFVRATPLLIDAFSRRDAVFDARRCFAPFRLRARSRVAAGVGKRGALRDERARAYVMARAVARARSSRITERINAKRGVALCAFTARRCVLRAR